jgi:phage terminase small subunit
MTTNLSDRHRAFADEYLKDFNGTAAYKRAGYKGTGAAAHVGASKLLAREDIQAYLQVRTTENAEKAGDKQQEVLARMVSMALGDIRGMFDQNGCLKPIHELTAEQAAMLQGVETFEEFSGRGEDRVMVGYTRKVRFIPRTDAVKLLGQHLGMFSKKVEVSGPDGKPVQHEHAVLEDLLRTINGADTGIGPAASRK